MTRRAFLAKRSTWGRVSSVAKPLATARCWSASTLRPGIGPQRTTMSRSWARPRLRAQRTKPWARRRPGRPGQPQLHVGLGAGLDRQAVPAAPGQERNGPHESPSVAPDTLRDLARGQG